MLFSIQRAVSDGTMTLLPVSIEYFDRGEISVLFNGVLNARQWAWVGTTDKTLSFTPPVANTVEVMVARSTDLSELRHQFSLGAQFTAESLDESLLQVLHIAQEATERQLGGDFFTDINMHGLQIQNLGAATAPDHAVTLAQYQADASGASAAKDTAVASASTAVAASNSASASASAALISANNADVSEFNALSSASSASASASTASTKATEAAASAAAALVSENAAELAESNAKASEVAAAASAAAALHPWEAEAGGIHYDLGNVRIGGVGKRITGDFSNATVANRVMFQTSTLNGGTVLGVLPNGTSNNAQINLENSSDTTNTSTAQILTTPSEVSFRSSTRGTGTYLPMAFYTGGSERMRINASGAVGIGITPQLEERLVSKAAAAYSAAITAKNSGTASDWARVDIYNTAATQPFMLIQDAGGNAVIRNDSASPAISLDQGGVVKVRLDTTGNFLVIAPTGLGYGTGAGGVVTQATSKSTAVTLNKPTGQITMNNAALAAGASVTFFCNCSVVGAYDAIQANIVATQYSNYSIKSACDSGHIYFILTNTSAGSLSDAVQIQFAIIKGAVS